MDTNKGRTSIQVSVATELYEAAQWVMAESSVGSDFEAWVNQAFMRQIDHDLDRRDYLDAVTEYEITNSQAAFERMQKGLEASLEGDQLERRVRARLAREVTRNQKPGNN